MPRVANIAHRGGAGLWPENTLEAFAGAFDLGCDGVELDCHLTEEGDLIVVHDFPPAGSGVRARAPRLVDVIRLANSGGRRADLWIELKTAPMSPSSGRPEATADAVVRLLRAEKFVDRAVIVGFDWSGPAHAGRLEPGLRTFFTTPPHADRAVLLPEIAAGGARGWFSHRSTLGPAAIADARSRGLSVAAWTVNEEAELRRLIAMGCDAICTDFPDLLARCVRSE